MRILLVEDNARIVESVRERLEDSGHRVHVAGTVLGADEATASQRFDLAVVDIGLPDGDGLDWCRTARRRGFDVPVLILTARSSVADRVAGLDAGADDYLPKPFSMDELFARIRALARRGPHWLESVRAYSGGVIVDRDRRLVFVGPDVLALTAREFDIVAHLAWQGGRVISREELLECVWGTATEGATGSLEVLIGRIRRKLADRGVRDALRTVRNVGYAWSVPLSKPS